MKLFFTWILFVLSFAIGFGQECNILYEDFESYNCVPCDIETASNGQWIKYDPNSPEAQLYGDETWGHGLDIPSNFSQPDNAYQAEIIQLLDIPNPAVVDYSFDFYNECGTLVIEFLESFPDSISESLITKLVLHHDYLVIGNDTLAACYGESFDFNSIGVSLDFDAQTVTLKCIDGPEHVSDFMINTSQLFGVAFGSNQCNYIDNICVNNSLVSSVLDKKDDDFVLLPNPSSSFIRTTEGSISAIFQLDGKLISTPNKSEIDIQNLIPGVYLAKIVTDQTIVFKRFVKV